MLKRLWVGGGVVAGQMHCKYLTSSSYLWWPCCFSRRARTSRTNPSQSVSPWVSHGAYIGLARRPWSSISDIWIFWPQACFIPTPKVHRICASSNNFYWYVYTNILTRSYPSLFKGVIQVGMIFVIWWRQWCWQQRWWRQRWWWRWTW